MFTKTSNRPGDNGETRYSLDSNRILTESCQQSATFRLQLVHCEFSAHGTFVAMHDNLIELNMLACDGDSQLVHHAICCVSLSYGASQCAFVGCLIDVRRGTPGEVQVVVTFPKELVATNLRQSFRVPVVENSGLEAKVRTSKNEELPVVAHDITEGGIEIELPEGSSPLMSVGSTIAVELKFRGELVQRAAEVRRIRENRCGAAFLSPEDESSQRQAARMRGIVLSLQQLWLKSRLT